MQNEDALKKFAKALYEANSKDGVIYKLSHWEKLVEEAQHETGLLPAAPHDEGLLKHALVGDKVKMYRENNIFYDQINILVVMLPLWIDAIAQNAEEAYHKNESLYAHMLKNQIDINGPSNKLSGEDVNG